MTYDKTNKLFRSLTMAVRSKKQLSQVEKNILLETLYNLEAAITAGIDLQIDELRQPGPYSIDVRDIADRQS